MGGSLNLFTLTSKSGACLFHLLHAVSHVDAHILWGARHTLISDDRWNGTNQFRESPANPACRVGHTSDFPTLHSRGSTGVRAGWLAIHTQHLTAELASWLHMDSARSENLGRAVRARQRTADSESGSGGNAGQPQHPGPCLRSPHSDWWRTSTVGWLFKLN